MRNTNMKKIFWVCSFLIFILSSCTGDKNNNLKYLKMMVETSADGISKTTLYNYKDNEIVSIDGDRSHSNFSYTNGLITKMVTLDKTDQSKTTIEYTYYDDKLIGVLALNKYKINYVHNTDGTVSFEKWIVSAGNPDVKEYHGILTFKNNNLIKEVHIMDNATPGVVATNTFSFEYDNKNNPFHSILGYDKLLDQSYFISANNNLISVVSSDETKNDQTISSANFYKNTITYDDDEYPKEKVSDAVMPSNGNSDYLKTEYFY